MTLCGRGGHFARVWLGFSRCVVRPLGLSAIAVITVSLIRPAQAQYTTPCPNDVDLTLTKLPEIVSQNGRLKGMIVLADGPRSQVLPPPKGQGPNPPAAKCVPQLRRFYQLMESTGSTNGNGAAAPAPIPGPTLRASLGDVVELTFLNQIDTLDYGNSIDVWENQPNGVAVPPGAGCDAVNGGYPELSAGPPPVYDSMPNCFHGSSTGNLHFHGTHTSPMGTADNVFLGIRPSPRTNGGPPAVTEATVKADFNTFFQNCEQKLKANNLLEWPLTWQEMGIPTWTANQETMLKAYDTGRPAPQQLWPIDQQQRDAGLFPQYYIGSFPYCFLLPKYPGTVQAPEKLAMGQAPGTMWYHAHKHGSTALNVSNSMAGAFIIEDNSANGYDGFIKDFYSKQPNSRKLPGQTRPGPNWPILQTTMVVNQIAGITKLETGGSGAQSPFSVNGVQTPEVSMNPGEVQMWRIVNASTISGFYLKALPAGFKWQQTAQDGVQFDEGNFRFRAERPVYVAPGNRIDLLVQAPASLGSGTAAVTVAQAHSQSTAQKTADAQYKILLNITLTGKPVRMEMLPKMPDRPVFLNDIAANETNAPPRSLTFQTAGAASGASQHTIAIDDGPQQKFAEGKPLTIDKLGTIEQWTIYNISAANVDHPFHIHINPFQVTEVFDPNAPVLDEKGHVVFVNGAALPLYVFTTPTDKRQCQLNGSDPKTWHPCPSTPSPYAAKTNIWWDVFPIPDGIANPVATPPAGVPKIIAGYFKMRTRFVDYNGSYVLHCHILAHEDRGMMLQVDLATTPKMAMMQHH